jgi:hypothetical protein
MATSALRQRVDAQRRASGDMLRNMERRDVPTWLTGQPPAASAADARDAARTPPRATHLARPRAAPAAGPGDHDLVNSEYCTQVVIPKCGLPGGRIARAGLGRAGPGRGAAGRPRAPWADPGSPNARHRAAAGLNDSNSKMFRVPPRLLKSQRRGRRGGSHAGSPPAPTAGERRLVMGPAAPDRPRLNGWAFEGHAASGELYDASAPRPSLRRRG